MTKSGTATASVNGTTIATTSVWEEVDNNVYFPRSALVDEYFTPTEHRTTCPWKGQASYYSVIIDGLSTPCICVCVCVQNEILEADAGSGLGI